MDRDVLRLSNVACGSLLSISKGVFGLNDAQKMWCKKFSNVVAELGEGVFEFSLSTIETALSLVCFVSTSTTCWERKTCQVENKSSTKLWDSVLSSATRSFTVVESTKSRLDGEVSVSMASYIRNLTKVDMTLERAQLLHDLPTACESHGFREQVAAMGHERFGVPMPNRRENVAKKARSRLVQRQ